jgi:hypothetical protein
MHPSPALGLNRLVEFLPRLSGFQLYKAGALTDGAVMRWRIGHELGVRTTFRAPTLIIETGSDRLEVEISWHRPRPWFENPRLQCPCGRTAYHLYWVDGRWRCQGRYCRPRIDHARRRIFRYTPELATLMKLRKKTGVPLEQFGELPSPTSLPPSKRRLISPILMIEQGIMARMGAAADSYERKARLVKLIP